MSYQHPVNKNWVKFIYTVVPLVNVILLILSTSTFYKVTVEFGFIIVIKQFVSIFVDVLLPSIA